MFHILCFRCRGCARPSPVWLLLFWLAVLRADPLPLSPGGEALSLAPYLEVIADPDQRMTLEQARDVADYAPRRPVPGTPTSTYWLRLAVSNPSARVAEWRLVVVRPDLDEVDFMVVSAAGVLLTQAQAGCSRPFAQHALRYHLPVFAFDLPAHSTRLLYLRLHGRGPLAVPLTLLLPETVAEQLTWDGLVPGLICGTLAIVALILAALVMRWRQGERSVLVVAAAVLALCISAATLILVNLEVVPPVAFSVYLLHLGAVLFMLFISLAQVQQIHRLRRQAQTAGDQLQEERSLLERRVAERTRALAEDHARTAAASRAKDEFLANVSHELRTPLNSVLGYAQLLLREDLSYQARRHLRAIGAAGHTLLHLVEDVLDLVRIETGQLDLAARPTDLRQLAWELEQLLSGQAAGKDLALVVTVAPEVPALVQVDPDRLRQILLNLLGNAVKFTAVGRVSLILCARREAADAWRIEALVSDTGPGIAPELTERVFERFARGSEERRTVTPGSGLGLAISRRLARAMGGDIRLESIPGRGSRFTLVLPSVPGAADPGPGAATAVLDAVRFVPGDVLAVDDDPLSRRLLIELLGKAGLRVAAAADGPEALALVRRHRPLLVLMDLHMPGLDGFATAGAMRADPVLAAIPLIALTAMADAETLRRLPGPFDGHLFKPWNYQSLLHLLARFLPTVASEHAQQPDAPPAPPPLPRPRTPITLEPGDWAQWLRLGDNASINEIAAFGRRLAWVGRECDDPAVHKLGVQLHEQAESFELRSMQATLRHLEDHVCPRVPGAR